MRIVLAALIVIAGIGGYFLMNKAEPESPVTFYERYYAVVKAGRSFDEDASFYSKAKRAEVEADLTARGNADEMKELYLGMTQKAAECATLALAEQSETPSGVRLVFDVADSCGNYGNAKVTEIIDLVEEDGWKISSNETRIEN